MSNSFRTPVNINPFPFSIDYQTPTMLLGSCFTENIGEAMLTRKFPAMVNPFGVIYNPISVSLVLKRIIEGSLYKNNDLLFHNNLWLSLSHHTSFSSASQSGCIEAINNSLDSAHQLWHKTQRLIVTFGTARVYYYNKTGKPVANCHKIPGREFTHKLLSVEEIVNEWALLLSKIEKIKPELKIVLTASPVRHWKDGPEGNQLSKATLILAINKLLELYPNTAYYFPSYEIMMDDLRDYRFYANDMRHPSALAIEYIWEKFKHSLIGQSAQSTLAEVEKINQAINHRPFNTQSDDFKAFVNKTLRRIEQLAEQNPTLSFSEEIETLNQYICNSH